jgi:hypothetical protein
VLHRPSHHQRGVQRRDRLLRRRRQQPLRRQRAHRSRTLARESVRLLPRGRRPGHPPRHPARPDPRVLAGRLQQLAYRLQSEHRRAVVVVQVGQQHVVAADRERGGLCREPDRHQPDAQPHRRDQRPHRRLDVAQERGQWDRRLRR